MDAFLQSDVKDPAVERRPTTHASLSQGESRIRVLRLRLWRGYLSPDALHSETVRRTRYRFEPHSRSSSRIATPSVNAANCLAILTAPAQHRALVRCETIRLGATFWTTKWNFCGILRARIPSSQMQYCLIRYTKPHSSQVASREAVLALIIEPAKALWRGITR